MKLAAPKSDGGVLAVPEFAAVPKLVDENRRRLDERFPKLRDLARQELNADGPVIVTGHQPELFHPGVWAKNFAACGLARTLKGTSVNLIVDSDLIKSTSVSLPKLGPPVTLEKLDYDQFVPDSIYEHRRVSDPELYGSFNERLRLATADWPFQPIGLAGSAHIIHLATLLASERRMVENRWGCENCELTVRHLAQSPSFLGFSQLIVNDRERFREVYNRALAEYRKIHKLRSRNHPALELNNGELPFWTFRDGKRLRTFEYDPSAVRPKALVLTLYARLILGDFFIHGLGGGKYDEVTDHIIREFFGLEPPAFQILTATLHLPFPAGAPVDRAKLRQQQRHDYWNPHQALGDAEQAEHHVIAAMPAATHAERRARFRAFREFQERIRPHAPLRITSQDLERAHAEADSRDNLTRRDYAWVLFPETKLKPFLTKFLDQEP